jgi:hypothetical protein
MISDNIVKSSFIVQTLQRDLNNIYKAQQLIATNNTYLEGKELKIKVRAGRQFADKKKAKRIIQKLQNPDFVITQSGENFTVVNHIVKELRFQDMKHLGNWKIYNRQVWGILYNNSLRDIRYQMTNNLRDNLGEKIDKAFQKISKK